MHDPVGDVDGHDRVPGQTSQRVRTWSEGPSPAEVVKRDVPDRVQCPASCQPPLRTPEAGKGDASVDRNAQKLEADPAGPGASMDGEHHVYERRDHEAQEQNRAGPGPEGVGDAHEQGAEDRAGDEPNNGSHRVLSGALDVARYQRGKRRPGGSITLAARSLIAPAVPAGPAKWESRRRRRTHVREEGFSPRWYPRGHRSPGARGRGRGCSRRKPPAQKG